MSVLAMTLPPLGMSAWFGEAGSRRATAGAAIILVRASGLANLPASRARDGNGGDRPAMTSPAAAGSLVVSAVSIAVAALVRAAILILSHVPRLFKKTPGDLAPGRLRSCCIYYRLGLDMANRKAGQKGYLNSSGMSSGSQPKDSATALACAARSIERSSSPFLS